MIEQSIALLRSLYDNGDLSIDQHDGIMRGINELREWQEKVCAIIQPAENSTEWGMDVADIIALRENQRREMYAALCLARDAIVEWASLSPSYDWNADPLGLTLKQSKAFDVIDGVLNENNRNRR